MAQQITTNKKKLDALYVRFPKHYMEAMDVEIERRGLINRTDAIRQLIVAWIKNPEALPIGLIAKK